MSTDPEVGKHNGNDPTHKCQNTNILMYLQDKKTTSESLKARKVFQHFGFHE